MEGFWLRTKLGIQSDLDFYNTLFNIQILIE